MFWKILSSDLFSMSEGVAGRASVSSGVWFLGPRRTMSCGFARGSTLVFLCPGTAQGVFGVWAHSCAQLGADAISHPGDPVGLSHGAQTLLALEGGSCSRGLTPSVGELHCGAVLGCHSECCHTLSTCPLLLWSHHITFSMSSRPPDSSPCILPQRLLPPFNIKWVSCFQRPSTID